MARKGKNNNSKNRTGRGSYYPTARTPLHRSLPIIKPITMPTIQQWNPPQRDHRRVPNQRKIHVNFSGTPVTFRPAPNKMAKYYPSSLLQPVVPKRAFICARRTIRKEVIFATGRNGRNKNKPRFTPKSQIRC